MREIKFRAWDKENKIFHYFTLFDIWKNIKYPSHVITKHKVYPIKDLAIDQYTGLKDKNGKEIWEGDIVWSEGHRLQFITEYRISMGGFMFCSEALSMGVGQNSHGIEIIGNIYENPELLKK